MNGDKGQVETTDKEPCDQKLETAIGHGTAKHGFQVFTRLCRDKGPLRGGRSGFTANDQGKCGGSKADSRHRQKCVNQPKTLQKQLADGGKDQLSKTAARRCDAQIQAAAFV